MTLITAQLPPELSHHWVKRLARATGAPIETARHWVHRGMPKRGSARRAEISRAIIAECDCLIETITAIKRRHEEDAGSNEVGSIKGRTGTDMGRAKAR